MLTVLLVSNIALLGMVVHTKKQTKGIAKRMHEIGFNLAYIQSNTTEIGINMNEVKTSLESKLEKDKEEMQNFSVKLTEVVSNQISENITESKISIEKQLQENKCEVINNTKDEMSKFLTRLAFTPIKVMDVTRK